MQNKVEEAEKKYKHIQERLDGITQQVQELQPKSAQLKAEAQRRNALLKSSEVSCDPSLFLILNVFFPACLLILIAGVSHDLTVNFRLFVQSR